jgi:hypothetical protein
MTIIGVSGPGEWHFYSRLFVNRVVTGAARILYSPERHHSDSLDL